MTDSGLQGAGARFADELGKRDYLTAEINKAATDDAELAAGMTLLVPEVRELRHCFGPCLTHLSSPMPPHARTCAV